VEAMCGQGALKSKARAGVARWIGVRRSTISDAHEFFLRIIPKGIFNTNYEKTIKFYAEEILSLDDTYDRNAFPDLELGTKSKGKQSDYEAKSAFYKVFDDLGRPIT
jgi:hypothetical protein